MSELFLRTLRDDPADAEVASHKLLIRAGYVRPIAPGLYSWLPLGLRVLRKIERVVREEMNAIGGQEILFPALLPRAPYETTNRWTEYGDGVFRLKDRRGNDYLLGPTHEELFTLTVKGEYSSYKDFPLTLYQIQTKYRDEARPRAGILRGREFVMKDSYSFDIDDAGLKNAYHAHREAYQRIFARLDVDYVIVSAVSGAMGGSASEEFLAESPIGEDTFVRCLESGYAANVEAVVTARPEALPAIVAGLPEAVVHDTGNTPTIATLVEWANGADLGRTRHRRRHPEERAAQSAPAGRRVGAAGHRGARRPRGRRQAAGRRARPGRVRAARRRRLRQVPVPGEGLHRPESVAGQRCSLSGRPAGGGRHQLDHRRRQPGQARRRPGRRPRLHRRRHHRGRRGARRRPVSPDGAGPLVSARGIEIGHIFQLGRKYTDAFTVDVLGEDGKPVRLTMGSYGVGVSRLVAVIAEQQHDELGLRWPAEVSPFDVHLVIANKDAEARTGATALAADLDRLGIEVLLDDRTASPGVKFKDAELLGVPWIVVVGRGWADGKVELRNRFSGETRELVAGAGLATDITAAVAGSAR